MKLYTFHQSGSSYRVRIALNLKGIPYEPIFVRGGRGSQELHAPEYLRLNPQSVIPTLVDGTRVLTQSMAILEYLEEIRPHPPLLPAEPDGRARVRALAQIVVSDIHPLITARVITYLDGELSLTREDQQDWLTHWNLRGLAPLEALLTGHPETGRYCHGDKPTLADICLIPHVYTARRLGCEVSGCPTILRIYEHCMTHSAFQQAAPENQADASH